MKKLILNSSLLAASLCSMSFASELNDWEEIPDQRALKNATQLIKELGNQNDAAKSALQKEQAQSLQLSIELKKEREDRAQKERLATIVRSSCGATSRQLHARDRQEIARLHAETARLKAANKKQVARKNWTLLKNVVQNKAHKRKLLHTRYISAIRRDGVMQGNMLASRLYREIDNLQAADKELLQYVRRLLIDDIKTAISRNDIKHKLLVKWAPVAIKDKQKLNNFMSRLERTQHDDYNYERVEKILDDE